MSEKGWISLHRKLIESNVFQNEKMLKVWIYCLLKATHEEYNQLIGLQMIHLKVGEFIFGRKKASLELNMNESTLWKYMKVLESMGNISINSNNKFSVIKVENYSKYQDVSSEKEQQNNNKITTKEQQNNTNNNINNINNNNKYIYSPLDFSFDEVINYLNEKANKNYKASTRKNQELIKARANEGFKLDDFKKVIDNKVSQWRDSPKMNQYLRPQTLFGTKFESYLNEQPRRIEGSEIPSRDSLAYSDNRTTKEERDAIMEFKLRQRLPIKKKGELKNGK